MSGCFPGVANTQQHDINGQPLVGALLTVYQGGSTSALASTYQDIGLVIPAPNPLVADASGRIPLFFVADGSYGLRLTDQFGIQSNGGFFYPQVPSIGASSSGGGGTPVDPTTVFSTGDTKWRLEESTIAGWVRVNGRTIGNSSSGASERANVDTQALFIYIWSTYSDAICPVIGGRGASALADFNANKQITLLDARGRAIFGLDDMGNAALGAFTGVTFSLGNATTGGSSGGTNATTLTAAQLPSITSNAANSITVSIIGGGTNGGTIPSILPGFGISSFEVGFPGTSGNWSPEAPTGSWTGITSLGNNAQNISVNSNNTGGQAFPSVPSALLGTLFIKL
jgi:hypothetical protein